MSEREFEELFWLHYPELLRYAAARPDVATAEDVVAETLATLWRKNLSYPQDDVGARQMRALLHRILIGHISNEHRARRRRVGLIEQVVRRLHPLEVQRDEPELVDSTDRVRYWLGQISRDDQDVVLLFEAGFSDAEIAEIMGCSTSAATKRRTRARDRLRAVVERERNVQA